MKRLAEKWSLWLLWSWLAAVVLLGVSGYLNYRAGRTNKTLLAELAVSRADLKTAEAAIIAKEKALAAEKIKTDQLAAEFGQIQGTVATLDKLSKTDPELLRRYSQVYFLADNYAPASLAEIDRRFWNNANRPEKINAQVKRHLEEMLSAASSSNAAILVASGYRSFGEQGDLKQRYVITYGAGANKFSADQGYSEHQLGTAVDLSTPASRGLTGFEKSAAYKWLGDNAFRFGFILSYPEKNGYFQFEPWHWRYVGVRLATFLHNTNKYFFTLPQREINSYLIDLFD
jgi:LAS superfamily LD-carboxypeptidase LdcB